MINSVVGSIISLLYIATTGVLFYLNQHYFVSDKEIERKVNLPLAKIRNAIVTGILRLLEGETVFDSERNRIEEFYDNILMKVKEERKILALERKLKFVKKLSMINIALPVTLLVWGIYLFFSCAEEVNLVNVVQEKIKLLIFCSCLPWIIYFGLYFLAEHIIGQIDVIEPRNTREEK